MEMIKGITGHGYHDELVVPIIENSAREYELTDALAEAVCPYTLFNSVGHLKVLCGISNRNCFEPCSLVLDGSIPQGDCSSCQKSRNIHMGRLLDQCQDSGTSPHSSHYHLE